MKLSPKIDKTLCMVWCFLLLILPASATEWHVTVNGKGYTYQYQCNREINYIYNSNTGLWDPGPDFLRSNCSPSLPDKDCFPLGANVYGGSNEFPRSRFPEGTGGTNGNGDGTLAHPWSLEFALSNPPDPAYVFQNNCCNLAAQNNDGSYVIRRWIQPGDIIWVHGGTYAGYYTTLHNRNIKVYNMPQLYTSYLEGSPSAPIIVRAWPCDKPVINSTGKFAEYIQRWDAFKEHHTAEFYDRLTPNSNITVHFKNPNWNPNAWQGGNTSLTSMNSDNMTRLMEAFGKFRPKAALNITGSHVEFWDLEVTNNSTDRNSYHGYGAPNANDYE